MTLGTKLEQRILALYRSDSVAFYSINEIARKLEKTYPNINRAVARLLRRNVLKKRVIGRSHLCTVNLESDEAIWLLTAAEIEAKQALLQKERALARLEFDGQLVLYSKGRLLAVGSKQGRGFVSEQEFMASLRSGKFKEHVILKGFEAYYSLVRKAGLKPEVFP